MNHDWVNQELELHKVAKKLNIHPDKWRPAKGFIQSKVNIERQDSLLNIEQPSNINRDNLARFINLESKTLVFRIAICLECNKKVKQVEFLKRKDKVVQSSLNFSHKDNGNKGVSNNIIKLKED